MKNSLSILEFNYDLPDSSVAKYPLPERDQSKLLVWRKNELSDHRFNELPELLPEGSMLVFNNTRVIHARLNFTKSTGAKIEIFCLEPTSPHDYVLSFAQTISCRWKCMVGNLKRWKGEVLRMEVATWKTGTKGTTGTSGRDNGKMGRWEDEPVPERSRRGRGDEGETKGTNGKTRTTGGLREQETERREEGKMDGAAGRDVASNVSERNDWSLSEVVPERNGGETVVLCAELMGELEGGLEINFSWDNPRFTFSEILEAAGNIPIPPYLHRESERIDLTVYQTVYSKIKGSVAAPTAGLHFTEGVFKALACRDIACEELTLHVGAGTFQPVKSETVAKHRMHTEHFSVNLATIDRMVAHPGKVIAVGTTSVRTLESLYWIGCKILQNPQITSDQLSVTQWEPYQDKNRNIEAKDALRAISAWLTAGERTMLETATQIMILPGYQFRIINGLVTNFHQPQSTLLLLISAILGEEWKRVYAHALAEGYRFLSYGDANLYWV